jgi:hypothetical protein
VTHRCPYRDIILLDESGIGPLYFLSLRFMLRLEMES